MVEQVIAGVAGAGVFGGYHAAKYADLPGVRVAAIYDIDRNKAAMLARRHGAVAFVDFNEFLDAVDVVTVAAPASTHFDIARRALERGRHTLVEKPIALRLDHADHLVELAARRNLVLQTGHQERFVFDALGILCRKEKPASVRCVRANPRTGRGEDVSVTFDLMIHDIDLVRRLQLGELVQIDARGDLDSVKAEITFANGAHVVLECNRLASRRDRRMSLVYQDGIVEIDFVNRTITNTTGVVLGALFDSETATPALTDPLGYGVARFVAAVRGEVPVAVSGVEGRDALEWALLIDAAVADASSGELERMRAGA